MPARAARRRAADAEPLTEVLAGLSRSGLEVDADTLAEVVASGAKQRFELDLTQQRVRAVHGHSVAVDLELESHPPPPRLYHGTVNRFLDAIRAEGLRALDRQHVHLTEMREQALEVGARRGRPVLLVVDAAGMERAGHRFHRSSSGVWLTEHVPPEFLHPG